MHFSVLPWSSKGEKSRHVKAYWWQARRQAPEAAAESGVGLPTSAQACSHSLHTLHPQCPSAAFRQTNSRISSAACITSEQKLTPLTQAKTRPSSDTSWWSVVSELQAAVPGTALQMILIQAIVLLKYSSYWFIYLFIFWYIYFSLRELSHGDTSCARLHTSLVHLLHIPI